MQPTSSVDEIQLREPLSKLELDVRRFLTMLVHDARARQRVINTSTELLSARLADLCSGESAQLLGRLHGEVAKLGLLLTAVGEYADSLPSAQYSFRMFPLKISLQSALSELRPAVRESGATIGCGVLPQVQGDPVRLATVFRHLVSNAIAYRRRDVPLQIDIQAQTDGESWSISVQDNGTGVAPGYWESVFVPFSRVHGPEMAGAGLGLSTCRNIVEAHGGKIWLLSGVDKGTSVHFTVPGAGDAD